MLLANISSRLAFCLQAKPRLQHRFKMFTNKEYYIELELQTFGQRAVPMLLSYTVKINK